MLKKRIIGLAIAMLVFDVVAVLVFLSSTPVKPSDAVAAETFWSAMYHVDSAVQGDKNLAKIHAKPEDHSSAECIACHGQMDAAMPTNLGSASSGAAAETTGSSTTSGSAAGSSTADTSSSAAASADTTTAASKTSNIKIDLHFHLKLSVARFSCTDCHRTNRVWMAPGPTSQGTTSSKQILRINRFFCFNCHGPFSNFVKPGGMQLDYKTKECRMCHVGKMAPKHEQPFLSQVLSTTECLMCHGNNLFPWPPQHYTTEWSTIHGKYAGDRVICSECHNISTFCHDCHTIKPITHDSNWRAVHKQNYRADPQRCGTCHTAEWCNTKCHLVAHTADWRQTHNAYVTEHGRDVCMQLPLPRVLHGLPQHDRPDEDQVLVQREGRKKETEWPRALA